MALSKIQINCLPFTDFFPFCWIIKILIFILYAFLLTAIKNNPDKTNGYAGLSDIGTDSALSIANRINELF